MCFFLYCSFVFLFKILPEMLAEAKDAGLTVLENEVESSSICDDDSHKQIGVQDIVDRLLLS
jgi:hypothetical protein